MILQCPACDARFLVNDALIPREGREVRCGKCKNAWHVSANPVPLDIPEPSEAPVYASFEHALASATADEAELMAQSAGKQAHLPTLHAPAFRAAPFIWSTAALALLVMILSPIAFYPQWKDSAIGGIYKTLGWYPSDGLAFGDVEFKRDIVDTKTRFGISGNITNKAKALRKIDEVRVVLKDAQGNDIWARIYEVDRDLKPGDVYPFEITNVETAFGEQVKTVMMDVGNSYELMIR